MSQHLAQKMLKEMDQCCYGWRTLMKTRDKATLTSPFLAGLTHGAQGKDSTSIIKITNCCKKELNYGR